MTSDGSRRWAPLVALLAILVGITGMGVAVDRLGLLEPDQRSSPRAAPTETATVETVAEQLERVARIVEEVRDLRFDRIPEATYLDPDQLSERVAGLLEDYTPEDAEHDRRLLAALGAVPPDIDLRELLSTALSEQVAGFYDPRTGEMVVGTEAEGTRLGPLDEITLAHELQHALADQAFGLPATEDVPPGGEDASYAVQALIEGDATLTMVRYSEQALSVIDQARLLAEQGRLAAELGSLTEMPHYVQRSLLFPYEEGMAFVGVLEREGGWELVDAAYTRQPSTTLQILRPDLYLAGEGEGRVPRRPSDPGPGWERRDEVAIGAADLLFLFEAPGGDPASALEDPRGSAGRWRGGDAVLWTAGGRTAVAVVLVGEPGLCGDIQAWYRAAFPDAEVTDRADGLSADGADQDAEIRCAGDEVRIGLAPDASTAAAFVR